MPLFGQILVALYQEDIVDEDDIRAWHSLPASKGENRKPGTDTENFKKCWVIGAHMIKQFDDQESDDNGEDSDSEEDSEAMGPGSNPRAERSKVEETKDDANSDPLDAPQSEEESAESEGDDLVSS